jgi:hypothetical protein
VATQAIAQGVLGVKEHGCTTYGIQPHGSYGNGMAGGGAASMVYPTHDPWYIRRMLPSRGVVAPGGHTIRATKRARPVTPSSAAHRIVRACGGAHSHPVHRACVHACVLSTGAGEDDGVGRGGARGPHLVLLPRGEARDGRGGVGACVGVSAERRERCHLLAENALPLNGN